MNILFIKFKDEVSRKDRSDYVQNICNRMKEIETLKKEGTVILENTYIEELILKKKIDEVKEYKIGE